MIEQVSSYFPPLSRVLCYGALLRQVVWGVLFFMSSVCIADGIKQIEITEGYGGQHNYHFLVEKDGEVYLQIEPPPEPPKDPEPAKHKPEKPLKELDPLKLDPVEFRKVLKSLGFDVSEIWVAPPVHGTFGGPNPVVGTEAIAGAPAYAREKISDTVSAFT